MNTNHGLNILKLIMILIIFVFFTGPLWASPDVVALLRLYEGFKVETAAPAKVITSYYLKPISEEDVFLDVDISREMASLKRVFNLKDIKLMTQAGMVLEKGSAKTPFQVIVLNGRKLLLQLSTIEEKKNRFKVKVLEQGEKIRSLLETKIFLPEKKTTVLGFEDSSGKIYFLSFHRGKDLPSGLSKPINIKSIEKPKLIKSPPPKYPEAAHKAGIQGKVVVNATTDAEGRVVDTQVIDGPQELRQAAQEAIKQWQYEPYYIDGKAKPVKFTVIVKFNLDKKKKDQKPISLSTDQKPKLVKRVVPKYPESALKANIEGKVVIEAVTDAKGQVVSAKVLDGPAELREAALEAIKQWQYEPYIVNGVAKPVSFTVILKFRLDEKDKKKPGTKPINLSSDQKPKLIKSPRPKYPEKAIKAGIQGSVVIEATTDTKGHVVQAKVIEGHPLLNIAALEAIKQWQYEVYYLEGEPTPVTFTVVVKFSLDKKKTNEKGEK